MLNLMMFLAMTATQTPQMAGPIQPCIWPKCAKPEAVVATIQPCIWPKCDRPEIVSFGVQL